MKQFRSNNILVTSYDGLCETETGCLVVEEGYVDPGGAQGAQEDCVCVHVSSNRTV
jgi:hypothetical protein